MRYKHLVVVFAAMRTHLLYTYASNKGVYRIPVRNELSVFVPPSSPALSRRKTVLPLMSAEQLYTNKAPAYGTEQRS